MEKLLLDMDPGVDDALALLYALRSPDADVLGITTVAGNAPLEMTTRNALRVLEARGVTHIPVAPGAARPLIRDFQPALRVHGNDGLGESNLSMPSKLAALKAPAVEFIADVVQEQGPGTVTLIATGPLTNVAAAFLAIPDLASSLKRLVIMGGAFGVTPYGDGNVTPVSEFNIWVDPEAADIVLRSGAQMSFVGLDVTTDPEGVLDPKAYERLRGASSLTAGLAARSAAFGMERRGRVQLYDPLAVAVALDPTLVRLHSYPVEVCLGDGSVRGQTIADRRLQPAPSSTKAVPVDVCVGVDGKRWLELFVSRLSEA